MTDTLQKQSFVLALASLVCVGIALWALWHFNAFSTTEDVNIVVQPPLVRWIVALVLGLVVPQLLVSGARAAGIGRAWMRLAALLRGVASMPRKIDEIHAAVVKPGAKEQT
jgi:uncharacterized membrane protein YwzB